MQTFFTDYIGRLERRHNEILKAVEGLPDSALDWVPGPEMNSISVLVFHLTGAERYLIGDVAAQESSNRDRDAEFRVHDLGMDFLKNRLGQSLAYAYAVLDRLTLQDLEQPRLSPKDGRTVTVASALIHALDHTALHLGHIQLTRQLWEQQGSNS